MTHAHLCLSRHARLCALDRGLLEQFRDGGGEAAAAATPAASSLGIRPNGDTTIQPDLTQVKSEQLKKIYKYIDEHIDEHVTNLQKWIQQPSISNSGEGIPGVGRDGQGLLGAARLPGIAGLRRRHDGVRLAGQSGRLREVR